VWPPRRPLWKKMWNPRWLPRNGCNSRLIAKISIATIQVNLMPNHSGMWRRQHKFTWIVVINFLPLAYHHSHFLAATLDFTSFFTMAFLGAAHLFYSRTVLDWILTHFAVWCRRLHSKTSQVSNKYCIYQNPG